MGSSSLPKSGGNAVARFSDPRIIEFRPRPRSGSRRRPLVDPLRQFETDDRRRRMQQNFAAVVVLTLLVTAGMWLFHQLKESSSLLVCIEAGHENCLPIAETRGGLVWSRSGH